LTVARSASISSTGASGRPSSASQSRGPASTRAFSAASNEASAMRPSRQQLQLLELALDLRVARQLALLLRLVVLALELAQGAARRQPADWAEFVDEQHAVQVVDLVLPQPGGQVAALQLDELALQRVGLHLYRLGAADFLVELREAQAALLALLHALALEDDRIDVHPLLVLLRRGARVVDHEHLERHADLRRRQAEAALLVHHAHA